MTALAQGLGGMLSQPGTTLADRYVIEGECGRDRIVVLLSAHDAQLDRRVAIQTLAPEWARDPGVFDRFLRTARGALRLQNEHTVRILDTGTFPRGQPYSVVEYPDGHNFDHVLHTWGALAVPTAIDWVLQAAESIAEAHAQGSVHGDLKSGSLFLTRRCDGTATVKVAHFGLPALGDPLRCFSSVALTRPDRLLRSFYCLAPEQLRHPHEAYAQSDVWALGAITYEWLSGAPPFPAASLSDLSIAVLTRPPEPLLCDARSVDRRLEAAIACCLHKDPLARFADVAQFARAFAPHGTLLARASRDRIEHALGIRARPKVLLTLPLQPAANDDALLQDGASVFQRPASMRMIAGALLLLSALFAGVFMSVDADGHSRSPLPAFAGAIASQPAPVFQDSARPGASNAQVRSCPAANAAEAQPAPLQTPNARDWRNESRTSDSTTCLAIRPSGESERADRSGDSRASALQ
jgi:serine/threonine-protein kinase